MRFATPALTDRLSLFVFAAGLCLGACGGSSSDPSSGNDAGGNDAGGAEAAGSGNTAGSVTAVAGSSSLGGDPGVAGSSDENSAGSPSSAGGSDAMGGTNAAGSGNEKAGSSAGGRAGKGGASGEGTAGTTGTSQTITCTPQTWDSAPIGWATEDGGTTGGGNATPIVASSLSELNAAAKGSNAAVIHVSGTIAGTVNVGSNKTILGLCGAEIHGSLDLSGSANVIVRNLKIVGYNCTDSPNDCSSGSDAVHVQGGDKHLWFDHLDISDGSDGNLDITHGSDFITVSWTKFHYSTKRSDPTAGSNGHRFCNLIGHVDTNAAEDTGHLNVTFYNVWWADNVNQRMPRVRFGKVHVFNSLYTATGDSACIEVGVNSNIRSENNVFQGVTNTVDSSHANSASIIQSIGNQGSSTNIGGAAFTPPYSYKAAPVTSVASAVMSGAGPK